MKLRILHLILSGTCLGSSDGGATREIELEVFFIRHAESVWNEAQDIRSEVNTPSFASSSRSPSPVVDAVTSRSRSSSGAGSSEAGAIARSISPVDDFFQGFGKTIASAVQSAAETVGGAASSGYKIAKGWVNGEFYDAPLSEKGKAQAEALDRWLSKTCGDVGSVGLNREHAACVLSNPFPPNSAAIFVSNLKRTRETMAIALNGRFVQTLHAFNTAMSEAQHLPVTSGTGGDTGVGSDSGKLFADSLANVFHRHLNDTDGVISRRVSNSIAESLIKLKGARFVEKNFVRIAETIKVFFDKAGDLTDQKFWSSVKTEFEPWFLEEVNVMSELQERGCNQDARLDPNNPPDFNAECGKKNACLYKYRIVDGAVRDICLDQTYMNESGGESMTFQRVLLEFFKRFKYENKNTIIVVGHSHWLRSFIRNRFAGESVYKTHVIKNTAVVRMILKTTQRLSDEKIDVAGARIESIEEVYGGPGHTESSDDESDIEESTAAHEAEVREMAVAALMRADSTQSNPPDDEV